MKNIIIALALVAGLTACSVTIITPADKQDVGKLITLSKSL